MPWPLTTPCSFIAARVRGVARCVSLDKVFDKNGIARNVYCNAACSAFSMQSTGSCSWGPHGSQLFCLPL